jgi:putative transposase
MTGTDRALLVLLAGRVRTWRQALLLVQPETLLRWHRAGFRALWRRRSRPGPGRPPLPAETVDLIRQMAEDNPLWGAERIRGELAKLGLRVAKRTIRAYLRGPREPRPRGQCWATFLRNHAAGIWACGFLTITDVRFRSLYAFFVVALATRRVVHVGVTRRPTDAWVAQQLREATPFDQRPRYLGKFGATCERVAETSGIAILRTPYRAPRANAVCERFLGSVRRECLDHLLALGERHLLRVLREYAAYFNRARPHQGLGQATPEPSSGAPGNRAGPVRAVPVLAACIMTTGVRREGRGHISSHHRRCSSGWARCWGARCGGGRWSGCCGRAGASRCRSPRSPSSSASSSAGWPRCSEGEWPGPLRAEAGPATASRRAQLGERLG